jgi:uncharacterized membrane protein YcaP (DUF421 family)
MEIYMDYSWIWKSILIFFVGKFILRIGGRKSISQMTITQTIVMVGIGSLLIQPVAGNNVWVTFGVAIIITFLMILTEYLEVKIDFFETVFSGKSLVVIENGNINIKNLKKIRMTVDRLETRLRQSGVSSIQDVKYATIEVSGQIGYELKDDKKPLTKEDFMTIMAEITKVNESIMKNVTAKSDQGNIFKEVKNKSKEGNKNEP